MRCGNCDKEIKKLLVEDSNIEYWLCCEHCHIVQMKIAKWFVGDDF